jgi:uncharacterized membrane protein required for colicin V production
MSAIFTALLFVIFIAVVASLYTEGMWGNAIRLIDVVTSALVATNYFEPLANWIEGMGATFKSYSYALDFLSLWVLFAVSMIVLRGITDSVCKVKVRFLKIAEQIGSVAFACLVAGVMVSFATFTMHTAPLSKNFLFGGFQSQSRMMLGLMPDRAWENFARAVSRGSFSRSPAVVFDPQGQFRDTYEARREAIEDHVKKTGTLRTN